MKEKHLRRLVRIRKYFYQNKSTILVYFILRVLVILSMLRAASRQDYQSVFLCGLSLVLMLLPSILSHRLDIKLPSTLEIFILLFIFSAEILGEINSFYVRVPHWDTMLHTINGFLCAAVGFALVDLLNRDEQFSIQLSPLFLAIVAVCFSMTVGVLWEFFEYAADCLLGLDMQKDTIITGIGSVALDPTLTNTVIRVEDIQDVILVRGDGTFQALGLGGYLDVGIHDTMKDLLVNLVGAAAFSVIGFIAAHKKGDSKVAVRFIPQVLPEEEDTDE